ncbi:protein Cep78 homolog [Drosophila obscura]|uniref:protein Cep78 homolog n=1 Tax=Drosophila obscura TaxID=7282 RepID=UPI001BB0F6A8|nr:protein Cep78 homolog [Drosophila obscura]
MSLGRVSGIRNGTLRALAAKKVAVTVPAPAKKSSKSRSFYFRYLELCRAKNLTPVPDIRKQSLDKSSLEFYADKLSVSDWLLVNESLQNDLCLKSLVLRMRRSHQHNTIDPIDTENRARLFTQRPVVYTRFIFRGLVQSIANCVASNKNLTVLQLEGLPLYGGYIDCIAKSLAANDCLETLSFRKSIIGDKGCELVCNSAKYLNRIALFDLSECRITAKGAVHVADMVKMQKISRYTGGSHLGLRTLLLANNPDIGDQGLKLICDVLKEDAWIKVVDLQGCGLTDIGANVILDCLALNQTIMEFNLRNNEGISQPLHRSICDQLGTPDAEAEQEPAYDVSFFDGLQSLPKGMKFTLTELRSNNEMLEQRLSFERTLRQRAEKLNIKLSDQLMSIESPVGSEKEDHAMISSSRVEEEQLYSSQMEGEHYSQSELQSMMDASLPFPSHMLNEYLEMKEKDPIESQKYGQTLFSGLFNSSATTPAMTPRTEFQFSHFEEQQKAQRQQQQQQVRMVRSEMKYAERNVNEAYKKHESKVGSGVRQRAPLQIEGGIGAVH